MDHYLIKVEETLNVGEYAVKRGPHDISLTVRPFTECQPYGRVSKMDLWNRIASTIIPSDRIKISVKEQSGSQSRSIDYDVHPSVEDGVFQLTARQSDKSAYLMESAIKAIETALEGIVKKINQVITFRRHLEDTLKCFPELKKLTVELNPQKARVE